MFVCVCTVSLVAAKPNVIVLIILSYIALGVFRNAIFGIHVGRFVRLEVRHNNFFVGLFIHELDLHFLHSIVDLEFGYLLGTEMKEETENYSQFIGNHNNNRSIYSIEGTLAQTFTKFLHQSLSPAALLSPLIWTPSVSNVAFRTLCKVRPRRFGLFGVHCMPSRAHSLYEILLGQNTLQIRRRHLL